MMKKLMQLLLLCLATVPATAQTEESNILIYKLDGSVDTLLLNNVRDIYHSRADVNGVQQPDVSTLRLRTVGGERVYPLTEIDHVVMPTAGRFISFMGTADNFDADADDGAYLTRAPWRTAVDANAQAPEGTAYRYTWVSGDYIWLSTGVQSNGVNLSNSSSANGRFGFSKDLLEDQYTVYYTGTNSGIYNKVIIPAAQSQSGRNNSDHLGRSGDCGTATATRQQSSNYVFALDHKTPVLCFMPRVDSLGTIELKHVALKADKTITGTYELSTAGIRLDDGTGGDTITLTTSNIVLPHLKANAQDSAATYIIVAPQDAKTTFKLYYRVYDTRSKVDTVITKNVWWDKLEPAHLYAVNSVIPVRSFLMAYTDSCHWGFGETATLYGALNLPVDDFGFWWGYNKNLTNETKAAEVPVLKSTLSAYPEYKFSSDAVSSVKQKAYYYRAYAREGGRLLLGQVKKFGMEREIINMGTSVRWSSINIGAITAEDAGDHYAWGEKVKKTSFTQANYTLYHNNAYDNIGMEIAGNPEYDVVTATWRGCWRMPTKSELHELVTKCNWEWVNREDETGNSHRGLLVKNRNNNADSVVFLPAAGYCHETPLYTNDCYYMSGTRRPSNGAHNLYQLNNENNMDRAATRWEGLSIRPVFESNIETSKGEYLFIRSDSIRFSTDHTSTLMYGTMRGIDDVVTPDKITRGFVIGTVDNVKLDSGDDLKLTLTQQEGDVTPFDNGSYNLPLTKEQMNTLAPTTTYYVRSYLTYDGDTWYGDPMEMLAMTIKTDSTNWAVGMTTARLCGTVTGITDNVKSDTEIGFVISTSPDATIDTGDTIRCDSTVNNKFVCTFKGIENKQYYYRAYVIQGGRIAYGVSKMLGLEFVDLGLPSKTLWANINIGAQTPEDSLHISNYYAWGEIRTQERYIDNSYDFNENRGLDIAGTTYDAAQVNWRGPWRMPTKADFFELRNTQYCSWTSTTFNGKAVWKITSKINGKCIYLPKSGWMDDQTNSYYNTYADYWSSTLNGNTSDYANAWDLYDQRFDQTDSESRRRYGLPIRPVALVNDTLQDKTMIQLTTDSVQWEVGRTTATVYGYQLGLRYHGDTNRRVGFVWSNTAGIHANADSTQLSEGVHEYQVTAQSEIDGVKSGVISAVIPDIEDGRIYYYRAYAKVNGKYYFGEEREFGRRFVDLGLSSGTLWANINLGASSCDDSGDYYAWGETTPKADYSNSTYTKLNIGPDISGSSYDAAHVNWGGIWRMPTKDDLQELISECTWTEVTKYGQPMYKIVGKGENPDSIFVAKRGFKNGTTVNYDGTRTNFWTSNLNVVSDVNSNNAYGANLNGTSHDIGSPLRYLGYTVRPVMKYTHELPTKIYLSTDSTDWYVGNTNPRLVGAVAGLSGEVTYGFVVGCDSAKTALVINGENVTNVSATKSETDDTFRGNIAYTKDTTYYYRAYVKVGNDYYYGNIRRYGLALVDMGNGVKWASINIGAQISSDFGDRFAWGETRANKSSYTEDSYDHYENGNYRNIGANLNNTAYDAAKQNWGGKWRMPTLADMEWLVNSENCDWQWTTEDGVSGYRVTSRIEGYTDHSIFLPAAGRQIYGNFQNIGTECLYWTATHYDGGQSYYLNGNSTTHATGQYERFYGLCVRPVTTASSTAGEGGGITGRHKPGGSSQVGGTGANGGGNAGMGNTGTTIGD